MERLSVFVFGIISYLISLLTLLYLIGFVGNLWVPFSINGEAKVPLVWAAFIDLGLILIFGLQHSLMARSAFKAWLEKFLPPAMERSIYVLSTSIILIFLFLGWQPIEFEIWHIENSILVGAVYAVFFLGWGILFLSSLSIDHFELFGLRQTWSFSQGRTFQPPRFKTPLLYKHVRHPIYVGILMAIWATPSLTLAHLIFAGGMTVYVMVGIYFEEQDLVKKHGSAYVRYRNEVPKLIPGFANKLLDESGQHHRI